MSGHQHFRRGGNSVFKCQICSRSTRLVDQGLGSECCPQCYELAGCDNQFNDDGTAPTPEQLQSCEALLAVIGKRGGDVQAARASCSYIWPAVPA